MRRTEALVSSSEQSVGMTKSARARFSASGIWWPRMRRNFSGRHARAARGCGRAGSPGRRRRRRSCRPGPRRLSRTAGECRARPPARPHARRERPRAPAPPPGGPGPPAASAPRARPAPARPASCDSRPAGPVVPGNSASISATSAPSGPCRRWTAASASNTGTPSSANIRATVDLPMPIDPVRPRTIISSAARRASRRKASKGSKRQAEHREMAALDLSRTIARPGPRPGSCRHCQRTASYSRSR